MTDLLQREIGYLLRAGATYVDAPTLGEEVLDLIDACLGRFLGYSEQDRHAHVLWIGHTWLMDVWDHTPRLLFVSPEPNCGKTTALEITQCFVPRAEEELVSNTTEAAFYQAIEDAMKEKGGRPTILHDQLDKLFGNAEVGRLTNPGVENLIATGFQCSGTIKRKLNGRSTALSVYAAMALAGAMDVSYVPDALLSRSVTIQLHRALPGEVSERWNKRVHTPETEPLRRLLRSWIELVHSYAPDYRPDIPESLINRDADKYEPMFTVADLAGGHWPRRARVAAVAAVAAEKARATPSSGIDLLADIRAVFVSRQGNKIFTTDLLEVLGTMDPRWRRLDGKRLARMLQSYGIDQTNQDQRIGAVVKKGYRAEYFEDAWQRYLLISAATSATSATPKGDDDE